MYQQDGTRLGALKGNSPDFFYRTFQFANVLGVLECAWRGF